MKKSNLIYLLLSVFIGGMAVVGGTYAFFRIVVGSQGSEVTGSSYDVDMVASISNVKTSTKLIPVKSNLITTTVNSGNKCIDADLNDICSIFKVEITNNGSAQNLNAFFKTYSSTYTTDNLRYRLYTLSGSTYTAASDDIVISHVADTSNYAKLSNSNISIAIGNGVKKTYYLVVWLNDTDSNQIDDINKSVTGYFGFETVNGGQIKSDFIFS